MKLQKTINDRFSIGLFLAIIFLSLTIVQAAPSNKCLSYCAKGKVFYINHDSTYGISVRSVHTPGCSELCKDIANFSHNTKEENLQK
jgi:hypothetical protein